MLAITSLATSPRVLRRSSKERRTNGAGPTVTFLAKRQGAPSSVACDMAMVLYTQRMPATCGCSGRGQQSASIVGADGARTMMLVYNLPRTDAIYEQFNGIAGAAYFIAGLGMTALTSADENMVVVPIRSGLGLRLGYNVGYLKFTTAPTWNPF